MREKFNRRTAEPDELRGRGLRRADLTLGQDHFTGIAFFIKSLWPAHRATFLSEAKYYSRAAQERFIKACALVGIDLPHWFKVRDPVPRPPERERPWMRSSGKRTEPEAPKPWDRYRNGPPR